MSQTYVPAAATFLYPMYIDEGHRVVAVTKEGVRVEDYMRQQFISRYTFDAWVRTGKLIPAWDPELEVSEGL